MGKEIYYFSHDYYARSDTKMVALQKKYGMAGVGAFWCILEKIYEEGGYLSLDYDSISFELRIDTEVIRWLVEDSGLFKKDKDKFWSESALERLRLRCEKSEKARKSILKRWEKYERNTTDSDS